MKNASSKGRFAKKRAVKASKRICIQTQSMQSTTVCETLETCKGGTSLSYEGEWRDLDLTALLGQFMVM